MLTTNLEYASFDITTPNSQKNIEMILIEKWLGINPSRSSETLDYYKTNTVSEYPITNTHISRDQPNRNL